MERIGIDRLRARLSQKAGRVALRYSFYEQKNMFRTFNLVIPARWNAIAVSLGWATKAVDCLADRLVFREFERDYYGMNDVFRTNSQDVLTDSAILAAPISGCAFVYISAGEHGEPRLQVIDGANATGVMDPITRMLTEGYAVLERDQQTGQPVVEAYFTPDETVIFRRLDEADLLAITRGLLRQEAQRFEALGLHLEVPEAAARRLAELGRSADFGARPLRRVIRREITDRGAQMLLEGSAEAGDTLRAISEGEQIRLIKSE